jgi:hypothetical protein
MFDFAHPCAVSRPRLGADAPHHAAVQHEQGIKLSELTRKAFMSQLILMHWVKTQIKLQVMVTTNKLLVQRQNVLL